MTRFWWVRHGPTHEKAFVGWRDVPADLSDSARIARLNAYLPNTGLVVSSDLIRASTTADMLTGRPRLPDMPGLREFNFGDWDGQHFAQVAETHPSLSRQYWEQPGDIAPPNGESWNTAAARVSIAVDSLLTTYPDQDIILVAHIGVILTQMRIALGITPYQALGHHIDNFSITCLTHHKGQWQAGVINHIA